MQSRPKPRRRILAVAAAITIAPALTGCGTLDRDAVQTEIDSVASAAAEGSLVAKGVEQDRTLRSFSVIRTAELHKVAMNASEALQETPAEAGLGASAQKGAALGDHVAGLLERLHERPTDRALAHVVRIGLDQLAKQARDESDRL
jgi:hypothetical protein